MTSFPGKLLFPLALALVALSSGCMPVYTADGRWQTTPPREEAKSLEQMLATKPVIRLPASCLVLDFDGGTREDVGSTLVQAVSEALEREGALLPVTTVDEAAVAGGHTDPASPYSRARELAAAHQTPLALVCRERWSHLEGWNPLRMLYILGFTMLFVPGESLDTTASFELALVDVRTGVVIASASSVESVEDGYVRVGRTPAAKLENERLAAQAAGEKLARRINTAVRLRFEEQSAGGGAGPARRTVESKPVESKR
jgi:hypothetical protein